MLRMFPIIYVRLMGIVILSMLMTACSSKSRTYKAPSINEYQKANIAGYKHIRYWGDKITHDTYTRSNIKETRSQ